ncbi:hypothetical protein CXB51_026165 [Gossypium anomalum]|uniref:Uncharacterized protein n=1 Tax=Gossypium anomalum TaxID=47600 RepID=A0A8J6CNB6_9ROSI|nr:hypothetical protein CXB51_026165 [Gossypium anomalum]
MNPFSDCTHCLKFWIEQNH